jgi:hypothetical protein
MIETLSPSYSRWFVLIRGRIVYQRLSAEISGNISVVDVCIKLQGLQGET